MHQRHSGFIQGPPDGPDHQYRNRGFPWLQFIWWFAAKKTQEPPRTSKDQGNKIGPKIAGATSLEARAGATGTGKSTSAVSHRLGGRSAQFLGNPRVATRWGKFLKKTEVFQSFRSTYRAYSVSIVSTIVYPIPFSHIHIIFSIRTRVSFRCWLG